MKKLLSINMNRKIAKGIGVFNLLSGVTCPGATPICQATCYARKAERIWKSARKSREVNLEASKQPDFVTKILDEIDENNIKMCRVHESGDWNDQAYLDKWIAIATARPGTIFLAYTKSFHLNFSKAPANLMIYASVDDSTTFTGTLPGPEARLLSDPAKPAPGFTCTGHTGKNYCGDSCTWCWEAKGPVNWIKH